MTRTSGQEYAVHQINIEQSPEKKTTGKERFFDKIFKTIGNKEERLVSSDVRFRSFLIRGNQESTSNIQKSFEVNLSNLLTIVVTAFMKHPMKFQQLTVFMKYPMKFQQLTVFMKHHMKLQQMITIQMKNLNLQPQTSIRKHVLAFQEVIVNGQNFSFLWSLSFYSLFFVAYSQLEYTITCQISFEYFEHVYFEFVRMHFYLRNV